jgi:catechol 2,3-dioxygenase-like lactoylglutathione lyase family enzyme
MLAGSDVMATIAVRNIDAAREFYSGTLGLKELPASGNPDVATYESGSSRLLVYESHYAGTNKATVATWIVRTGLQSIAAELKTKGVAFEHYDLPGLKLEGDVHAGDDLSVVWLKDPDGNILSIIEPKSP